MEGVCWVGEVLVGGVVVVCIEVLSWSWSGSGSRSCLI